LAGELGDAAAQRIIIAVRTAEEDHLHGTLFGRPRSSRPVVDHDHASRAVDRRPHRRRPLNRIARGHDAVELILRPQCRQREHSHGLVGHRRELERPDQPSGSASALLRASGPVSD